MRYLSKYKLFLEEAEETSGDELPEFDSSNKFKWEDQSPEVNSEKSKDVETTQKDSESTESADKNNQPDKDKGSESTKSDGGLESCIATIISGIQDAYDEESTSYFFRPYAVSAWTSIFTNLILQDKEKKAVKDFFGDNINDKKSWWFGNVTSELSKHISINKDGKKLSLVEALEKNQDLKSIKTTVLAETKDKGKKNLIEVAFQILGKVRPELKNATISGDNKYLWYDETGVTGYEISVCPDFGVGNEPSFDEEKESYTFTDKQKWRSKLVEYQSKIPNIKSSGVWGMIRALTLCIDGLFKKGSEGIWKQFGGNWYGDDDTEAAKWLKIQKNFININILKPLKEKIKTFNYSDRNELIYYTKEIGRIDTELLDGIIKKMEGNFDLYDVVEFTTQSFDKKDRVYIEVDTDF